MTFTYLPQCDSLDNFFINCEISKKLAKKGTVGLPHSTFYFYNISLDFLFKKSLQRILSSQSLKKFVITM